MAAKNLPSTSSAGAIVEGDNSARAWIMVAAHALARGSMIAAGGRLAGLSPRSAILAGAAGALAIEAAIFGRMYAAKASGREPPRNLPTQDAVTEILERPSVGAAGKVIGTTAGRAVMLGAAALLVGLRGDDVMRAAIGGSLAVEAFVVGWTIATDDRGAP
jgi:hypothetical protein